MPTHNYKSKTYQQMLPQSAALESVAISPLREGDTQQNMAGDVHCRGEEDGKSHSHNHVAMRETDKVTHPKVLVISKTNTQLIPCHPARARHLIKNGKAKVIKKYPMVIQLTQREDGNTQPVQIKLDTGASSPWKAKGFPRNIKNYEKKGKIRRK